MPKELDKPAVKKSPDKDSKESIFELSDFEFESCDEELNNLLESLRSLSIISPRYRIVEDRDHIPAEGEDDSSAVDGVRLKPALTVGPDDKLFEIE